MQASSNTIVFTGETINGKKVDPANPLKTHMALKKLFTENHLQYLITTNTDGLHAQSGIEQSQIYEINGNKNIEKCFGCEREYLRDIKAEELANIFKVKNLGTRLCENKLCLGTLMPTKLQLGDDAHEKSGKQMQEFMPKEICETISKSQLQISLDFPLKLDSDLCKNQVIITQQEITDDLQEGTLVFYCSVETFLKQLL